MKENKTEKPTLKKKRDAGKKGQTIKSRDIISTVNLIVVMLYLFYFFDGLNESLQFLLTTLPVINDIEYHAYFSSLKMLLLKPTLGLIAVTMLSTALPTLLQTRFVIASKTLKIDFNRLNAINGFKRIFSLRTLLNTLKSLIYLATIVGMGWMCYDAVLRTLLSGINGTIFSVIALCKSIFFNTLTSVLLGCALVALIDYFLERFHYTKELMMSRQEVKKEFTEQNGQPAVKQKRRELHQALLNEDVKRNVRHSQVLLANPTHIVIGIYFNLKLAPYPFVSLVQTDDMARAVLAYAGELGKPIYRDKKLVREMYKSVKPHTFLHWSWFDALLTVLRWMEQIEKQYSNTEDDEKQTENEASSTPI